MTLKRLIISLLFLFCFMQSQIVIGQIEVVSISERKIKLKNISQSRVNTIAEDNRGVIWIGTFDGLNSFDGYNTIVYRRNYEDSTSISNNIINSMEIDHNGYIWVGTNSGLNKLKPETGQFELFWEHDLKYDRLKANVINELRVDDNGLVWMATSGAGIVSLNPITNKREYITLDYTGSAHVNQVMDCIEIDDDNNVWFANNQGDIGRINSQNGEIELFGVQGTEFDKVSAYWINNIYCDVNGKVWFTLTGFYYGLYYYDKERDMIVEAYGINNQLRRESRLLSSLHSFSSVTNDRDGNMWVASSHMGIFKVDKNNNITAYIDLPFEDISDCARFYEIGASALLWGSNGILWKGTNGYGLEYIVDFDFFFHTVKQDGFHIGFDLKSVRAFEEDENYLWISGYSNLIRYEKKTKHFSVATTTSSYYAICNNPQKPDELIIGTEGGGLCFYNKVTNKLEYESFDKQKSHNMVLGINVYELKNQGDSIVWIGRNSGLEKYKLISGEINRIEMVFSNSEIANAVSVISSCIDSKGNAWFGTMADGIWEYDAVANVLRKKIIDLEKDGAQPQRINSLFEDSRNNIWVCTDNGIYTSTAWDKKFKLYTVAQGLSNDFVYASLEDDFGNIWFSTNNGLSCFNITNSVFSNYYLSSGIQDNEFNTGAYFKDKAGNLYFGGIDGFTSFKPDNKKKEDKLFPLILLGASTNLGELEFVDNILILDKETAFLNIEFSLLSFLGEKQNFYQYRNLSNDTNWLNLGNSNKILFDRPSNGRQLIEVRARTLGGKWNTNSLKITLVKIPYLWETWFFWPLIIILLFGIVIYFVVRRIRINKQEKKKLEMLVNIKTGELQLVLEESKSSNATKDRLFSIIAHDLRSPLNSLLGFSSILDSQGEYFTEEEKKEFISIIHLSSKNLNNLLDNLLNWSRLQMKNIKPSFTEFLINELVESNLSFLDIIINQKKLNIKTEGLLDVSVFADYDMVSVIVRNLLSNAIKFTQENGQIVISMVKEDGFYKLGICDNGVGMTKETLDNLFNSKEGKSQQGTNKEEGTGLGLLLCHDFALLNNGKLTVSSALDNGSCFFLYLKVDK